MTGTYKNVVIDHFDFDHLDYYIDTGLKND